MMSERKVEVILRGNQGWIVREALESTARMIIGQPSDMFEQMLNKEGKNCFISYEDTAMIQRMVTSFMGLYGNATGGVGWNDEGDTLWDLYQVIRHRISWDHAVKEGLVNIDGSRNWRSMMGVSYDDPMKHGPEPLAKISGSDDNYKLVMNQRQAELLKKALNTCLAASVGHFGLSAEWPRTRENGKLQEEARSEIKNAMEKVACDHVGISLDQRLSPENSPIFGDIDAVLRSIKGVPENSIEP